ncbi:unnamed protein product, partial [Didymodactylos carnosus]
MPLVERLRTLILSIKTLNLFESRSTDEVEIRYERITTRLYLILLSLSFVVLVIYTALTKQTITVNIESPSFSTYRKLEVDYSHSLKCSCSQLSFALGTFIHIKPTFHQVCTSDFVSSEWLDYLANIVMGSGFVSRFDFRKTGLAQFQALTTLCRSAQTSTSASVAQFLSTNHVSATLVANDLFNSETTALIRLFQRRLIHEFYRKLRLIRDTTHSNKLAISTQTTLSAEVEGLRDESGTLDMLYFYLIFGDTDCSCDITPTCIWQLSFYHNGLSLFDIPNFYRGCLPIQSIRQSSIECFYNQTCIDTIQSNINSSSPMNARALDSLLPSRFPLNATVRDLLNQLAVEDWGLNVNYSSYYHQCNPLNCTYTYVKGSDYIHILTTIIELVGGLTSTLRIVTPLMITIIRRMKKRSNAMTIKYSEFIDLQPLFHQVCSSVFVTNKWFDFLYVQRQVLYLDDFRLHGAPLFRILATFCQLANDTIADALVQFYSIDFITPTVLPSSLFKSEIESSINMFQKQVPNTFTRVLSMTRDSIHVNQLFTSVVTEFQWNQTTNKLTSIIGKFEQMNGTNCSCLNNSKCLGETYIRDEDLIRLFIVPNFFRGCYLLDGLLSSTLDCFYNNTCLTIIKSYIHSNTDILPLDPSLLVTYRSSTKINDIVLNLMVEIWNKNISFRAYYLACKPEYCRYTINARNNYIYIVTTAIGLVGGLITIFQIITPYLMVIRTKIEKKYFLKDGSLPAHVQFSMKTILRFIRKQIIEFNLFESTLSTDEDVRYERRTTRLYVILLAVTLYVLTVYNAVLQRTKTTIFDSPSLSKYLELRSKYSQNLECHCSHLSVKYDKFIRLQPSYHYLCSSVFITQQWIDHLSNNDDILYYTSQFQALALLCKLANQTVSDSLELFYSTYLISSTLVPPPLLEYQISSFVDKFQTQMANTFLEAFNLIQDSISANQFISAYETNFRWYIKDNDYIKNPRLGVENVKYNSGQCDCARTSTCIESAILNNTVISGFYIGCLPIETILQSSLECLYDQTCINMISARSNITAINSIWPTSQFQPNTTIKHILSKLMIEQWNIESFFDKYYNECLPKYCTYTYVKRYDLLSVSTTIIGLFGGLTTAFEFMLPTLVNIFRRWSQLETSDNVANTESLVASETKQRSIIKKPVGRVIVILLTTAVLLTIGTVTFIAVMSSLKAELKNDIKSISK